MKAERGGADGFFGDGRAEDKLIEKARYADRKAFEELMTNYLKILYNYVSHCIGSKEDVGDIVQETMLAVWKGLPSFHHQSAFQTWVLGIARRKAADYYRTVYRQKTIPLSDCEDTILSEDEFDRINDGLTLHQALAALSKTEREIVFLVFDAQLKYAEVSQLMGIPVGTVKSKMSGIKAKLSRQLEKGER